MAYGLPPDAPEDNIQRAARLTGVDQIVDRLPAGWATRVGRGGCHLSAGQRRQVALARALANNPPILLLDEPASALDPEAEAAFSLLLQGLAREKTILIAAPRLPASLKPAQTFTLVPVSAGNETTLPSTGTASLGEEENEGEADSESDDDD